MKNTLIITLIITLLGTAGTATVWGQTASTFAQRYEAIYGRPLFESAPAAPAPLAPVVVYSQSGDTLNTSAGPIVLINSGLSSEVSAGLRPLPLK